MATISVVMPVQNAYPPLALTSNWPALLEKQ